VPGTDAAFLLALVNVFFADALVDLGNLAGAVNGVDDLRDLCRGFTPEAVAATCGIDAGRIRALAHELAGTERAVLYGGSACATRSSDRWRPGWSTSSHLDPALRHARRADVPQAGGVGHEQPSPARSRRLPRRRWHSRVRGAPEVLGQVPVSCLAEEIDTPVRPAAGPHHVAGNPVISAPGAGRLDAALPQLECMISVDNWINETTRHAHVILPGCRRSSSPTSTTCCGRWRCAAPANGPSRSSSRARSAARVGDPHPPGGDCAGPPPPTSTWPPSTTGSSPRSARPRHDPAKAWPTTTGAVPSGWPISPFGPAHGVTGTERFPTGSPSSGSRPSPTGSISARWSPGSRDPQNAVGQDRAGPALSHRRRGPPGDRLDRPRSPRAGQPPPRALEELLDAQRECLVKGKDRCTLFDPPRRRSDRPGSSTAAPPGSRRRRHDRGPRRGQRRDDAGVCASARVGPRPAGNRLSVARDHPGVNNNLLAPLDFVDTISGNAAVNGIPVEVAPPDRRPFDGDAPNGAEPDSDERQ